jgi:hypothetical protein
MRSIEVERTVASWADEAWRKCGGDWQLAGAAFIKIVDRELSKLDAALAVQIEDEVWKSYGNSQINKIVQRSRGTARIVPPAAGTGYVAPPTGQNSRRTKQGDAANKSVYENLYLDKYYLKNSKVKLRDALFDDVVTERRMHEKLTSTHGNDMRMLCDIEDKLRHDGFSEGDPRPIGVSLGDAYVETLRAKHYAV